MCVCPNTSKNGESRVRARKQVAVTRTATASGELYASCTSSRQQHVGLPTNTHTHTHQQQGETETTQQMTLWQQNPYKILSVTLFACALLVRDTLVRFDFPLHEATQTHTHTYAYAEARTGHPICLCSPV